MAKLRKSTEASVGESVILRNQDMPRLVATLSEHREVIGPLRKGNAVVLAPVARASQMAYHVGSPLTSPKTFLHPPQQRLFRARRGDGFQVEEVPASNGQVLFGIHPCDVQSLFYLDRVFGSEYPDPYYQERRKNILIVALNCTAVGDNCFCASMGTGPSIEQGYDLALTNLGDRYLVDIGSDAGINVVREVGLELAGKEAIQLKKRKLEQAAEQMGKRMKTKGLPELLAQAWEDPHWDQVGGRECLSCGNCAMVCPTCYCYQVADQVDLTGTQVERNRSWDVCLLLDYAAVHGGNFRKDRKERYQQFIYHKLNYSLDQYQMLGCVGCGRCITWCPVDIDITEVIAKLRGEK